MTHPNQHIIDALHMRKAVLFRLAGTARWIELNDAIGPKTWISLMQANGEYEFKLKPKMIKIGDTEVVAPLGMILFGEIVYCLESDGAVHKMEFDNTDTGHQDLFLAKRLFAEKHQAEAFHKALLNYINSQC